MKTETIPLLLYSLHYIDDIDALIFNEEDVEQFRDSFSLEKRKKILPELEYVISLGSEFDFKTLMSSPEYSNEDILMYLKKLHAFIKTYETLIT